MEGQNHIKAKLIWRDQQPYSCEFDDVYFSSDNGLLETDYVFLKGNQLAKRWQDSNLARFTIIETGFGTGLNFLCAATLWQTIAPKNASLHFISLEKYPLAFADLSQALDFWPSLKPLSLILLNQYQHIQPCNSNYVFEFSPVAKIKLTLFIGDVIDCLNVNNQQADAWFLDGFSPRKNPEMWQASVFNLMAKFSHQQTTFSTFTSASMVKRGLLKAGFMVNKQAGYGKKREMLLGKFAASHQL